MKSLACTLACFVLAIGVAAAARADAPASIPDSNHDRAEIAFDRFAAAWMERAYANEEESRANPTVKPGVEAPLITYRGYGEDYTLELRPTGNPASPYVGLLRYTENVYRCADVGATECTIVSSVPVTEIFRYQSGRWRY